MAKLLRTKEVAERLGVTERTLERMRVRGDGPAFVKLGAGRTSVVRYEEADLEAWLESRRRTSTAENQSAA